MKTYYAAYCAYNAAYCAYYADCYALVAQYDYYDSSGYCAQCDYQSFLITMHMVYVMQTLLIMYIMSFFMVSVNFP